MNWITNAHFFGALTLTVCLVTSSGCGAQVDGLVGDLLAEQELLNEILCSCPEDFGVSSSSECEALYYVGPSTRECIEDAYNLDTGAAIDHLQCVVPLYEQLNVCLDSQLVCGDNQAGLGCVNDFSVGLDSCPALPGRVQRSLESC